LIERAMPSVPCERIDRNRKLCRKNLMNLKNVRVHFSRTNKEEIEMRHIVFAMIAAMGLGLVGVSAASAVPVSGKAIAQAAEQANSVTAVAGGCGVGWHRGPHGGCRR
jgi:hypothetical protein